MTTKAVPVESLEVGQPWWLSRGALMTWWILSGIALGFAVGVPPVQRTQEARVLETAREMMGHGFRRYMVPHLNGILRVRKPPLAYWMAVGAYKIGGVSEAAGRVPTVIIGWMTILVTFLGARWLFGTRAGFFAAGTLLTSYLFFRHTRLAETDAPAMFFVTVAVLAFWRGALAEGVAKGFWWFQLGAIATALAVMSKGPPGFYPSLFLLSWCAVRRDWKPLARLFMSGAPLTMIVLAAPWFIYVLKAVGIEQWKKESDELLGGQAHGGIFLVYFPMLLQATAPWFLVVIGALVAAFGKIRGNWRLQGVLLWTGAVFVPLCFLGNKQNHYLTTLMPPLMILSGWWLDSVLQLPDENAESRRVPLLDVTMLMVVVAVPAILVGARMTRGRVEFYDVAMATLLAAALAFVALVYLRRGITSATVAFIFAALVVTIPAVGVWVPLTESGNSRTVAREITRRFGNGPYCFYGFSFSLPLCFNLKAEIPLARQPAELGALAAKTPGLIVISQSKSEKPPLALPADFVHQSPEIRVPGQIFRIYKRP